MRERHADRARAWMTSHAIGPAPSRLGVGGRSGETPRWRRVTITDSRRAPARNTGNYPCVARAARPRTRGGRSPELYVSGRAKGLLTWDGALALSGEMGLRWRQGLTRSGAALGGRRHLTWGREDRPGRVPGPAGGEERAKDRRGWGVVRRRGRPGRRPGGTGGGAETSALERGVEVGT